MTLIRGVDYSTVNPDNKWKILKSQSRFALWALLISSGVVMQGFDLVAGGQLAALPVFKEKFGILQPDGSYLIPAHYLSAWNSIAPATEIVSTFIFAPLLEKFGRKWAILAASLISVAGVLLQQLAPNWRVHLAGRGVNGIAIGMMFTVSPLWIGETCRPELRGFFLCFFNTSIVFGQFAIVVVSEGSSHISSKWQWWLPLVAQYVFPFILTVSWPFFPESPYWLVRHGRPADAKKALRRIYGFKEAEYYEIEVSRLEEEIRITNDRHGNIDAEPPKRLLGVNVQLEAECFDATNRNRTLTAIFAASAQQMIGATFVIGYATYFFQLIGIKNYFGASIALYVVMLLASTAAFPLTEIYGRRFLIVGPQFILCFMLLIIGILGCVPNKARASWGVVALLYIWALIYQLSIGATGFVLASEIATMRLRGATQGLITITNSLWGLIMQFTVPYMINPDAGDLGGKVGFIFLATGLIAGVGGWYLFPETKGLSFEKLDELYAMKVPPRHFKRAVEQHPETESTQAEPAYALRTFLPKEGDVHVEHA
ncbi:general substrate transporter [Lipomyces tetrasporus]|uniref:General substrate transporter n=1 Tax=Lipomyces tetrasporus TaxID=54092 RepID=A0AAD7VSK9_9ASCO|nr:general substrate transporter [Lipomyces tetrasporus]KAJ8100196.1 general substrate transporter [Lipomyces tetrasporus]